MRFGWRLGPGTGAGVRPALASGVVALVVGLVGLLIPVVLVLLAVALAGRALLAVRGT